MSSYPDNFRGTNMDEPREKPEREYEKPDLTDEEIASFDWTKNPSKEKISNDIASIFAHLGTPLPK